MKTKFLAALVIACAGLFAGLFAGVAAPASADCSPSFTSIPCTIVQNVGQAPSQLAGQNCPDNAQTCGLVAAPLQLAGSVLTLPQQVAAGAQTPQNLVGVNCPAGSPLNTCGLTGAPGQFFGSGGGLEQIATAPQTIASNLLAAPGQFVSAIQNGGTAPATP